MNNSTLAGFHVVLKEIAKTIQNDVLLALDDQARATVGSIVDQAIGSIDNATLTAVVTALMKCGKSTFINAFLGEDILPHGTLYVLLKIAIFGKRNILVLLVVRKVESKTSILQ
jgi:hypothetical protein